MTYVLIRHKVRDFKSWKLIYDAHMPSRLQAGLTELNLTHKVKDPNDVFLLFSTKDSYKAAVFVNSTELRRVMKQAGVLGEPEVHLLQD